MEFHTVDELAEFLQKLQLENKGNWELVNGTYPLPIFIEVDNKKHKIIFA